MRLPDDSRTLDTMQLPRGATPVADALPPAHIVHALVSRIEAAPAFTDDLWHLLDVEADTLSDSDLLLVMEAVGRMAFFAADPAGQRSAAALAPRARF